MGSLVAGKPKIAIASGLLAIVTAAFVIIVLAFGLFPEGDSELLNISAGVITRYLIMAGCVLAGGVLVLYGKYRLGGVFAVTFSTIMLIQGGFILIPSLIGGILALRIKEQNAGMVNEV